jgi:protoheme IX farnesyltransferase
MIKLYYRLAKPGIIYGNAITAVAGFLLASRGEVNISNLIAMVVGISLVVASACVFNNYLDRDIDARMERTKKRALVQGHIHALHALLYAFVLGVAGFMLLVLHTNLLCAAVALFGFVVYVGLYTPLKRKTTYATLIGAFAGAVPPIVGFAAVTSRLDLEAALLFLILIFWQMPHFFAIGIRRLHEYAGAGIPILPMIKGVERTQIHIMLYITAFTLATLALFVSGFVGYAYAITMSILCTAWLVLAITGFWTKDDAVWAKKVFLFSLVMILTWSVLISFDYA